MAYGPSLHNWEQYYLYIYIYIMYIYQNTVFREELGAILCIVDMSWNTVLQLILGKSVIY
jgi:hypothetical protein